MLFFYAYTIDIYEKRASLSGPNQLREHRKLMLNVWLRTLLSGLIPGASFFVGALVGLLPGANFELNLIGGVAITLLMWVDGYFRLILPAKRWRVTLPKVLDIMHEDIDEIMRETLGVAPRFNFMVPKRRWRKWGRYFVIEWELGMDEDPDVDLEIPLGSGVVGSCFDSGEVKFASAKQLKEQKFPFPERLKEKTSGLEVIMCYPVKEPRKDGRRKSKSVGVLTLDSKTNQADELLRGNKAHFTVIDLLMRRNARILEVAYKQ